MKARQFRGVWLAAALVLIGLGSAGAQDVQKTEDEKKTEPAGAAPQRLLPAALADQLNLSDEQRKKIGQLEKEYKSKRDFAMMQTMLKFKSAMDSAEKDGDKAIVALAITNAITGTLLETRRTQKTFENRLLDVLTEEQRNKFRELKKSGKRRSPTAAPAGQDTAKNDAAKLQGVWAIVSVEIEGEALAMNKLKDARLTIKGKDYSFQLNDMRLELTCSLDASKTPKAIDLTVVEGPDKGKTYRGIYVLENEQYKICRPTTPDKERPTEFVTRPNSGLMMVVWKKEKIPGK